ncbi:MAG: response regulator transcription factor [Bacteroidota bacterium]
MEAAPQIDVILADDHALVRDGIRSLLEGFSEIRVLAEAADGEEALEQVEKHQPDILIVDIRMPKLNGIQTVARLSKQFTKTKALVLSMHDSEEYVIQSVEAGAYGYLLKDTNRLEFLKAIKTIHKGEKYFSGDISTILVNKFLEQSTAKPAVAPPPAATPTQKESAIKLTKRQREILQLAVEGMSNKEIADHLGKSVRTVEAHRFTMMKKMGVKNLLELSKKARAFGLID